MKREIDAIVHFDYAVVNDQLEICVDNVAEIIQLERSERGDEAVEHHGRDVVIRKMKDRFDFELAKTSKGIS